MVVDLFCGAGGWSCAARELGLEVTGFDSDTRAVATYTAAGHAGVLTDLRSHPTQPCTGVMASPPCQPYTKAGKEAGRDDERGSLALVVLTWAAAQQPDWVAVEQVEGGASMVNRLAAHLTVLGYRCALRETSAEQYGAAQVRRRIVLMAHKTRKPLPPKATHSRYNKAHPHRMQRGVKPWVTMADALGYQTCGTDPYGLWTSQRWPYLRPSPTIVGTFHPEVVAAPGWRNSGHRQDAPGSVVVTVEQAGVLQGFPADYPWQGSITAKYRQVGNAFPPPVARAVLEELL